MMLKLKGPGQSSGLIGSGINDSDIELMLLAASSRRRWPNWRRLCIGLPPVLFAHAD
jgi:hypothetical protein